LIAGVALLAMTGAGDENTDVIAHVTGFVCGAAVGALHAWRPWPALDRPSMQWASGLAAVAIIAGAWGLALR
jgi:hypothetical protein